MPTVFGPDISSYQSGLDLSRLSDASFVIAKATEGTYFRDPDYDGWRLEAASLGKLFAFYHFLSGQDARAQAAFTLEHVGNPTLPGMLDVEPAGSYRPSLSQALAYIDTAHAAGLNLRLMYLPRWYWEEMGSPSLSGLKDRGVALVASSYPGGTGSPTALYPGDGASGWQSYGGLTPLLLQFTDRASDGGYSLDYNAARLTLPQLAAFLHSPMPSVPAPSPVPSTPGGSPMGTVPPSISQRWPDIARDFPPDAQFTDETALIWADAGARAAALYALQARDAINALAAKVGQPPAIDAQALGAAIAAHLASGGGASADDIAGAVVAHLAATLAKG